MCILYMKALLTSWIVVDSKVWDGENPKMAIAFDVSIHIPDGPKFTTVDDMLNGFQIQRCKIL